MAGQKHADVGAVVKEGRPAHVDNYGAAALKKSFGDRPSSLVAGVCTVTGPVCHQQIISLVS